ncbi:hypothetical protein SADUNF_Sadunf10G0101600 [Salix dunnii]|uniref:Uncharacterized protein n=1 Tax=Salix dunnii TaxID=1413687 RepID=A0A835JTE8_9ROSI|nr:hypothetical protein SADUNF_Sadunf10G0101600 [Salix dunnii]
MIPSTSPGPSASSVDHIQQNSIMMPSTSPGPSASSLETERSVELTITIDSSSSSASTQTPTQENLSKENRPFHRIIETLREQELGRHILILAVPMTIGLFSVDNLASQPLALRVIAVALALGFAGIWNGILLRQTWNEASNMIELLGVAFMLLAFFGFVALFLPESLVWIPFLCLVLSLLPLVIAICSGDRASEDREGASPGPSASSVETERSVELTITNDSSSSASTQTPTQENLSKENRPFHRIIETLREQELGRHILILAVPMTIGLFSVDNLASQPLALRVIAVALALGFAGIWNGILLRKTWNEASNMIELLGVAFMLLAFFGFVALFLPESLVWIPFLCLVLSLLPLVIAICSGERASEDREG